MKVKEEKRKKHLGEERLLSDKGGRSIWNATGAHEALEWGTVRERKKFGGG